MDDRLANIRDSHLDRQDQINQYFDRLPPGEREATDDDLPRLEAILNAAGLEC